MYSSIRRRHAFIPLLGPDQLHLSWYVSEVVGIRLRHELPLIGLLDEVLIALLVRKINGVLLGLELYPVTVHEIGR